MFEMNKHLAQTREVKPYRAVGNCTAWPWPESGGSKRAAGLSFTNSS